MPESISQKDHTPEGIKRSQILLSILDKIENAIHSQTLLREGSLMAANMARFGIYLMPFGHKEGKDGQKVLTDFLSRHDSVYNQGKLLCEVLEYLKEQGVFTEEEVLFIEEHKVITRRIILERFTKNKKHNGSNPEREVEPETIVGEALAKILDGVDAVLRYAKGSEDGKGKKAKSKINLNKTHEIKLLQINIFETAKLPVEEFAEKIELLEQYRYATEAERVKFFRRVFDVKKSIPESVVVNHIMARESMKLAEANEIWMHILRMYLTDEAEISKYSFPDQVESCNDFFGLFEILNKLIDVNKRYNEIKDDQSLTEEEREAKMKEIQEELNLINFARIKFAIGSRASSIRRNILYARRESVKAYLDSYLMEDIFEDLQEEYVRVPTNPNMPPIKLLRGRLPDPDTGEFVEVYLYPGGDSAKPKAGQKGIVNIKGLYKIILKDFSQKGEVKDFFRITVMPVNPNEIEAMRAILNKTITHPLSRDKESVIEEEDHHNPASSYKDKDIEKLNVSITPYASVGDGVYSGAIEDTRELKEGDPYEGLIKTGPIPLEVRTGTREDILPERDGRHETSHRSYAQMRVADILDQCLPPNEYEVNWIGRARQKTREVKETLRPEDFVLYMTLVTRKEIGAVFSGFSQRARQSAKAFSPEQSLP